MCSSFSISSSNHGDHGGLDKGYENGWFRLACPNPGASFEGIVFTDRGSRFCGASVAEWVGQVCRLVNFISDASIILQLVTDMGSPSLVFGSCTAVIQLEALFWSFWIKAIVQRLHLPCCWAKDGRIIKGRLCTAKRTVAAF